MNPPFDEKTMNNSLTRYLDILNKDKSKNIKLFISLPIWDNDGIKWIKKNCKTRLRNNVKYNDFPIIKKIKNNKRLLFSKRFCKENFEYFDYISFTKINAVGTYIFIFS